VLSVDGATVHSAQDALARIATQKPGAVIAIHGLRGQRAFDVKAHVGERPRTN